MTNEVMIEKCRLIHFILSFDKLLAGLTTDRNKTTEGLIH